MTLDRFDFIKRIIAMYPHAIKGELGQDAYYDSYKRALSNPLIDFEKLFDIFSSEYKKDFPPTAAWLKEAAKSCYSDEGDTKSSISVKIYDPRYGFATSAVFPGSPTKEQIVNMMHKRFPQTAKEDWKILSYEKFE